MIGQLVDRLESGLDGATVCCNYLDGIGKRFSHVWHDLLGRDTGIMVD